METLNPLTAEVFRVLAHPVRLAIIDAIGTGTAELEPLASRLGLTRPALRRHLAQLAAAGIVGVDAESGSARYLLASRDYEDAIETIRHATGRRLARIQNLAELTLEGPRGRRHRRGPGRRR